MKPQSSDGQLAIKLFNGKNGHYNKVMEGTDVVVDEADDGTTENEELDDVPDKAIKGKMKRQ